MKRLCIKFPPEANDGDKYLVVDAGSVQVADVLRDWARYTAEPGDSVSVQVVELDESEYRKLVEV